MIPMKLRLVHSYCSYADAESIEGLLLGGWCLNSLLELCTDLYMLIIKSAI
jgi:hypothetical protein